MTDWPVKTLGEVCEVTRGTSITRKETKEGMIPVVAGGVDVAYFHSVQNRPAGTITISSSGANAGFVNRWEIPIFASDCSTVVAIEGGMVLGDYAFRFLQFKQAFINAELRRGAAQPHVYAKDIAAIEIPVPPLEEQKRIVELLDAATARVTELTACYEQARTHANNLFTSALRDALESNPDWPGKTIGDVCEVVNGATPKTNVKEYWGGSHAWITPAEMGNLDSPFLSMSRRTLSDEGLAACSATLVPPKTVILSSRAPIGHLVINEVPMATNQGCKSLIPNDGLDCCFLYYYLKANIELLDSLGTGAVFKELSGTQLKTVEIPVPPLEEQKRIVAQLDSMRAKTSEMVAAYDAKLVAAKNLRQSVLEAAFAGEL